MPNRKSAMKHVRADEEKRARNSQQKSALRKLLKQTETGISTRDVQQAQGGYRQAASLLDRAAQKGVIKKGAADRKKSRLAQKLNKMGVA